jgi:hypothetical protein
VTYDRPVVFSTSKPDHNDITEILLKVTLNTITPLNDLDKVQHALYLFKGRVHLRKNIYLEEHLLKYRKGFVSFAINGYIFVIFGVQVFQQSAFP